MSEHTKLPKLAVGYMDQGMGHGHYAILRENTGELFAKLVIDDKDDVEQIVLACNAHKDLLTACEAMLVVTDKGEKPRKLDEALTWRQNDELARRMAKDAIAKATPK